MNEKNTIQNIICKNCGAKFDDNLPECPYCGTMNYKGAKAEYMEKLRDIRDDMEDLQDVPMAETKREFKKQGSILKKVCFILVIFYVVGTAINFFVEYGEQTSQPTAKEIYIWQETTFPTLDEMYEQQNYGELMAFYEENAGSEYGLWEWEHCDFCQVYIEIRDFEQVLREELAEEEPSTDRIARREEWAVEALERESLDEEERAILESYFEAVLKEKK